MRIALLKKRRMPSAGLILRAWKGPSFLLACERLLKLTRDASILRKPISKKPSNLNPAAPYFY